jgi:AraC-like DNA-binding protein
MASSEIAHRIAAVCGRFTDAGTRLHFHETYSVGVILAGRYEYRSGSRKAILGPGEIRIVSPYELHQSEAGSWEYLHFDIDETLIAERLAVEEGASERMRPALMPLHRDGELYRRALKLYDTLEKEPIELEESFDAFLERLLASSSGEFRGVLAGEEASLRRALEYLHAYWYRSDLRVREVARAVGFSPYYFVKKFRQIYGMTPHHYLLNLRIEKARARIVLSRDSLAQVAMECGFSDQSHMIRLFRRYLGYTPGALRRGRRVSTVCRSADNP